MPIETLDVPAADGTADAFLARPDGDGRHPGVLLAMDAIGLRPRIAEMAGRLAAAGYVVLAPNLLYRDGRAPVLPLPDLADPDSRGAFMAQVRPMMARLDAGATAADGRAYLDRLAQLAPGPVGVVGYCMGARFALRTAAVGGDAVAAVAGFHGGGLVTDAPDSPHGQVGAVRAEAYFGHADDDPSMTPEQVAALDQALDAAGVRHVTEVYAGAAHGYTMSDTAAYDEGATERHWDALLALLDRTLPAAR